MSRDVDPRRPPATTWDPLTMELEPLSLDPATIVSGAPTTSWRVLETSSDGLTVSGIWEMTPGSLTDIEVEELFVVLFGRATVEIEGSSPLELRAGTVGTLRDGDRTTWHVHETLRKAYQDVRRDRWEAQP